MFGPTELAVLATALRAYVNAKRESSLPVTSWSNLVARKWPREYALSKQATGTYGWAFPITPPFLLKPRYEVHPHSRLATDPFRFQSQA